MSNVNITINGNITVNFGNPIPSELEAVIRELAETIIEDENAGSEGNRDKGFSIALITPDEIKTAVTFAECADFIDEMENGCEFRVKGECFNLFFERKGLMTFCNEYYLVIPAFTLFHDEQDRPGLVYIVCTGDFVQTRADDAQWEYASAAMDTVDSIPCGVLAGNHDAGTSTQDYTRFSTWFGEKRYADKPWYGGSYEDNYCHFDLIDAGETSYIFVYIGYAPTDGAIKYAVDCFDLYPERIGVLCTHDYFKTDVTLSDNGQALYDRVVAQCENIYMVLCGHRYNQVCVPMPLDDDGDGAMDRMVYQLLMNYQAAGSEGGGGFLRFMQIDEAAGTLRALSYSPTADDYNYYDAPESQTEKYPASPLFEAYTIPLPWTVY